MQKRFECLGFVEFAQNPELIITRHTFLRYFNPLLKPFPLFRVLDVHVLDSDSAAVGISEHSQDVAQFHQRFSTEPTGGEFSIQVPESQIMLQYLQICVIALVILEGVGVRNDVPANPKCVDQFLDSGGLVEICVVRRRNIARPTNRNIWNAECAENFIVEAVLT